ncbi:MAG: DUF6293 family protein [Methanomassiliicoccales archaeon]
MRVLVCTFGFSSEKILAALKHLPAPLLVLVTSEENLLRPGYAELCDVMDTLGQKMEVKLVDKFDFMDSLEKVRALLLEHQKKGDEVMVNISGGVPLLSDAALLAAFHVGIPTYYVDKVAVRLPVLKDVKMKPLLSIEESRALLALTDGMDFRAVDAGDGPWGDKAKLGLRRLKDRRFVRVEGTRCFLTPQGNATAEWIRRSEPSG